MNEPFYVYAIGLLAQVLFGGRQLVQWISSERAKKVLSPTLFWYLSLFGSLAMLVYGWMREDFAIILGQLVAYYIYIWNLNMKGEWSKMPRAVRWLFFSIPIAAAIWFLSDWQDTVCELFTQEDTPMWMIVYGATGQILFQLRFIYQWWYSRRVGESVLPVWFWIISLGGSLMIVSYALLRHDPILILGQATGMVVYVRNLMIWNKERHNPQTE